MALETVSKTIDGKHYEFEQFNTTKSLKVLSDMTSLIGEPILLGIASGYKAGKDKAKDKAPDDELLAKAVKELVAKMGRSSDVLALVKSLSEEGILCEHKAIVFDLHYAGPRGFIHLIHVIKAAVEVQYGNFTDVAAAIAGLSQGGMTQG